ncbi:phage tail length tape measure family protein [Delftia tsuruhatensis]|uniref:phage tail length tape measure family protein n=1 Tax=Delftia tsuruhatensis TaxID=180282 RepID=UPI0031CFCA70
MSALGSLVVKLALEYAQFSQGLQSSEQDVKQHAKRVQDAYDNMAAGVSSRMDSLKGSILAAIGGAISVVGITSAISKIKQETIDAEKEQTQLAAAIKSTGGAAGWSIERLNAMADSMEKTSTFSAGQINQAQTRMLSYAGVVGEQFPRAMQAVIDMSERMGYEVTASAETIGKALDVPSEGLTALSKQGFRFTDAQKELVKQFERTGQTAKAQDIILQALESSYGGAAQAARDTLGGSLTAVGNTINSLMTADSASLPGLRDSVEGLNSTLNSDDVRNGFQTLISGLIDVGSFAASSMAGIVKLGQAVAEHKGEIGVVLGMIAGTATAAGALQVANAIGAAGGVWGALTKVRGAVIALSLALAANPATLVLLGIGAATGAAIASNLGDPVGDRLSKEIEFQTERLAQAEALLARAGGPKGQMTAKLEERIAGIKSHLDVLRTAAGAAKPAVEEVATQVAGVAAAANSTQIPLGQSEDWIKKYGTAAQKAALEVEEWKRKLGSAFTPEMQRQVEETYAKQDAGAKASAQSAKQLQTSYDNLLQSIAEKTAEQHQELSSGEALAESDKIRIKFNEDLKDSLKGLTAAQRANVLAKIDTLAALEKENEAAKKAKKAAEEERKYRQEWLGVQAKTVEELEAGNKSLREEIELIGLSADQQRAVLELRQLAVILSKEQQLAEMERAAALTGTMTAEHALLQQEITLLRERLALTSQKDGKEAAAKASAASVTEWQKGVDQIGQSLTDQLMAGGRSFGDYLKNLARTLILRPLIMPMVQPVAAYAANMLGLSDGGGTQGNALAGVKSVTDIWSAFSGGSSGVVASGVIGLGKLMGSSFLGELGAGIAAGGQLGVGGVASLWGSASGTTAAGMGLGAAIPYIGVAIAIFSLLKSGLFGSRGPNHSGGVYSTRTDDWDDAAKQALGKDAWGNALGDFTKRGNKDLGEQLGTTVKALAEVYKSLSKYASGNVREVDIAAGFATNPKYGDEDAHGYFQIIDKVTGEVLKSYKNRDLGNDPEKAFTQFVADMGGALVGELKKADLPAWMRDVFDELGDDITLDSFNAMLQKVQLTATAVEGWTNNIVNFGEMGDKAIAKLIKDMGGIENAIAGIDAFYAGFYTESERVENAAKVLDKSLKDLKLDIDPRQGQAAKEQFRKIVEAAMAAGDVELLAKLLPMAQMFSDVADAAGRVLDGLKEDRSKLEAEYLRATGQTDKYREALRRLATEGMSEAERAAWDYNEALRAEIAARDKQTDLERQLLELSGDTAELRRRELAALDPSNRALQQRIWAIEDEREAVTAAHDLFRRAYQRDRDALQGQASTLQSTISAISSAVGMLNSTANDLWGSVDSTRQLLAAQGMVYIERALAGMRAGASVTDYAGLQDAIGAARNGITSGEYTSEFERRRDTKVLAGQLAEMGEIAGIQLSFEERQLKAVQTQIEQLDLLANTADELVNGTAALSDTVRSYFDKLLALIAPKTTTPGQKPGGSNGGGAVLGPGGEVSTEPVDAKYSRPRFDGVSGSWYEPVIDPGTINRLDGLYDKYHAYDGTGDLNGLMQSMRDAGATLSDLEALSGYYARDWAEVERITGIKLPAFDIGTNYVPFDMPAIVHAGERIVPAADNRRLMAALDGAGGPAGGAVLEVLQAVRQGIDALREAAEATAGNTSVLPDYTDQRDRVSGGGNADYVVIANVEEVAEGLAKVLEKGTA